MFLNKRVLCLIPARGGSKGIKFKNLQKIGKKSLVQISIDFAKSIKFLDKIVVSSDNSKILNIAKNSGVYHHLRPNRLSKDFTSDYELIREIIKKFKGYEYLLYLQPTSPIRKKKDFVQSFKKLLKQDGNAIWSVF